jgi:hypothetical protein
LDSGHKALCPWKENACSETLAQFPPASPEVLAEGFKDRCKKLSQLPALPVISDSAIDFFRTSKGSQIDCLLLQSVPDFVASNRINDDVSINTSLCAYNNVRKMNFLFTDLSLVYGKKLYTNVLMSMCACRHKN